MPVAIVAAALVAGSLTGCGALMTSSSCDDFISLPTAQDRFDAAPLVVVAKVSPTKRIADLDAAYPIYRAAVARVLKGSTSATALDVVATSDQCTTQGKAPEYIERDPLAHAHTVILYLGNAEHGVRKLFVPDAVDPAPADGSLPFSPTASPSPTPSASR